ncbi:MAG: alanine--glyoxylate aminotransferase family protein [Desulfarculaceae bacterium]|nr:alanine--glyoxylate aminotransferase family protein [Desulfarculaceae bacterium]MCF8048841.1 alanine--glyoxylate aminotransferase family protein [Desulfarculaceae bacterium]MCF8065693.1 alanine--glyoxylate aminotransferase family protein [Desulfarculaceae bacterium]MCF8099154.1 alanine--glyoxylate aminotransferase family protein [Desulfarculaceae bacterium]MCF8122001.1 alanine--glyoxylate aminotransferase family protein [Desulfarculaceae bacterium]
MDELKPPQRLLLGPGPCNVPYRVRRAMSTPLVGHLDPLFMKMMDEVCQMLRQVFKTENQMTFPVSGTGSAGMEATFVNLLEPGDTAVVCQNGVFGTRMIDVAERCGAKVIKVEAEWSQPLDQGKIIETLKAHPEAKLCAIVYAETSTGVLQPIQEIGEYLKGKDTLFLVDTVTALGGVNLEVDAWGIDASYSGTQKCLAVPPGLAPVTFGPKAMEVLKSRKTKVQSWYLDLTMLSKYWSSDERLYHHTAPITMIYGLREGLRIVLEEGLDKRIERHAAAAGHLAKGLSEMGFGFWAAEGYRLPPLTCAVPPQGWDVEGIRKQLLTDYDIEVGGGLGPAAGKIWRIGLMGENACVQKVAVLLRALQDFA